MKLDYRLSPEQLADHSFKYVMTAAPAQPEHLRMFLRPFPGEKLGSRYISLDDAYVLWIALDGCVRLLVDSVACDLTEGEAVLTFPGQPHMRRESVGGASDGHWLLVAFRLASPPDWFGLLRDARFKLTPRAEHYLELMFACCQQTRVATDRIAENECAGLAALLLNELRRCVVTPENRGEHRAVGRDELIAERLYRLLIEGKKDPVSLRRAAAEFGVTPGYMKQVFRKVIGCSPARQLRNIRYYKSLQLLRHSKLNITEIAREVGFQSVYAFSRFFRSESGVSPLRFRRWRPDGTEHPLL